MSTSAPVETKVKAGAIGAVGGGVASQVILWFLGCAVWGVPWDASHVDNAIASVPGPLFGLVAMLIPAVASYWAGYQARHTPRPDLSRSVTGDGLPFGG